MRIQGRALARNLGNRLFSRSTQQIVTGLAVGITAVTVIQQTINTFGVAPALCCGLLAGLVCGLASGSDRDAATVRTRVLSAVYLMAIVALWPFWLATLMDAVHWLPTSVWSWSWMANVIGFAAGVLSVGVPAAVWRRVISGASPARDGLRMSLVGVSLGALFQVCILAPAWGLWWPACVAAGVVTLIAIGWPGQGLRALFPVPSPPSAGERVRVRGSFPLCSPPLPNPLPHRNEGEGTGKKATCVVVLAFSLGLIAGAVTLLLGELWPVSAALWHVQWAAVVIGIGCFWRQATAFSLALLTGSAAIIALGLASGLTDFSLWMSCTFTSVTALEAGRVVTIFIGLAPIGALFGQCLPVDDGADLSRSAWPSVLSFSIGLVAAQVGALFGGSPIAGLIVAAIVATAIAASIALSERPLARRRRSAIVSGMAAATAGIAIWTGASWDAARPARLLFSTHVFLAARTGWEAALLPHLDDQRPLAQAPGRHGTWTLWQARGGEIQLRENGIPQGTLTTAPTWSPQFAPEVLPVVWPLVLVDQPARVLVLGARSGAALQAALVFPIREVICQEPDAAVVRLIRGPIAASCGHDPFADDRCRWVRQPEGWLAPATPERVDVIVSHPATAALQSCAEEFTTEFYHRAANQLADAGVFCQRFSSVDFGPEPLLMATAALETAFPATACLEIGTGEYLLLGAWHDESLVRPDLSQRLEAPHVATLLARCQRDWAFGLNSPAYDRAALAEAAQQVGVSRSDMAQGRLSFVAARELMRWAPKLQEIAAVLSKPRERAPVYPLPEEHAPPRSLTAKTSRQSRYLEWLGPNGDKPAILRRLAEVVAHQKLVKDFPDTYWWEYRRELREELQNHPRSALDQVSHSDRWHPEDRQRKAYFAALGAASKDDRPDANALAAVEAALEPDDPLLTLFGHQEVAELYARGDLDPVRELRHRLHVIYYAPAHDVSVRNVVAAIDHVVEHPTALADDRQRFDVLNGLLQTLRSRWEGRNLRPQKSAKVTLQELDRSLVSVERAVQTLEPLSTSVGYTPAEWAARETVLDRLLLRPFRTYRDELKVRTRVSELKTRELLQRATGGEG